MRIKKYTSRIELTTAIIQVKSIILVTTLRDAASQGEQSLRGNLQKQT